LLCTFYPRIQSECESNMSATFDCSRCIHRTAIWVSLGIVQSALSAPGLSEVSVHALTNHFTCTLQPITLILRLSNTSHSQFSLPTDTSLNWQTRHYWMLQATLAYQPSTSDDRRVNIQMVKLLSKPHIFVEKMSLSTEIRNLPPHPSCL
jgi:hypothetical protein